MGNIMRQKSWKPHVTWMYTGIIKKSWHCIRNSPHSYTTPSIQSIFNSSPLPQWRINRIKSKLDPNRKCSCQCVCQPLQVAFSTPLPRRPSIPIQTWPCLIHYLPWKPSVSSANLNQLLTTMTLDTHSISLSIRCLICKMRTRSPA